MSVILNYCLKYVYYLICLKKSNQFICFNQKIKRRFKGKSFVIIFPEQLDCCYLTFIFQYYLIKFHYMQKIYYYAQTWPQILVFVFHTLGFLDQHILFHIDSVQYHFLIILIACVLSFYIEDCSFIMFRCFGD